MLFEKKQPLTDLCLIYRNENETLKIFCQNVKTLQDLCSSKCTKVHFNPKWEAFLEVQKHHWVSIEIAYQRNVAKYYIGVQKMDECFVISAWIHRTYHLDCLTFVKKYRLNSFGLTTPHRCWDPMKILFLS